ncbi:hypothetical protein [Methylobacterium tarhaniae]|nr:hypothetical protein [Methylobacterium tarhaniae]
MPLPVIPQRKSIMKAIRFPLATLIVGVMATHPSASELGNATQTFCADGTGALCSVLPTDMYVKNFSDIGYPVTSNGQKPPDFNQTFTDYFAWQAFIALNWPTDGSGKPSTQSTILTDTTSPRVWSTYKTKEDVFGTQVAGIENANCASNSKNLKVFRTSKFELTSFEQAFKPYPLIDRYGNFVLYDVRLNDVEVNYLQKNNLTTSKGQSNFKQAYDFPRGAGNNPGAIEIKSSWRIMTEQDDKTAYYTTPATIIVPPEYSDSGKEMCIDTTVGLVGMHIAQKFTNPTPFSDFWLWATFEHVANAPMADGAPVSQLNDASPLSSLDPPICQRKPDTSDPTRYSFYDPTCKDSNGDCPINTPPATKTGNLYKWSAVPPYAKTYMTTTSAGSFGTQVARCFAIYESARSVTGAYQAKLGGSPWSKYMLVGAQWAAASATEATAFRALMPFPAPIYLSNTTLETYLQDGAVMKPENGAGSCITCHNRATDTTNKPSNFSFLPGAAK